MDAVPGSRALCSSRIRVRINAASSSSVLLLVESVCVPRSVFVLSFKTHHQSLIMLSKELMRLLQHYMVMKLNVDALGS